MTRMEARPYQVGDENYLECWRLPRKGSRSWIDFVLNLHTRITRDTYTYQDSRGAIHGIGGLIFYSSTNAEAWTAINDESLHRLSVIRCVRDLLHRLQAEREIIRVWSTADSHELDELTPWFEYLGMEHEAFIPAWGQGGVDVNFFARIRRVV